MSAAVFALPCIMDYSGRFLAYFVSVSGAQHRSFFEAVALFFNLLNFAKK